MSAPFVIDLRDPDYWRDPYPTLRAARAHGRTAVTHTGEPVVLRADDNELLHTSAAFAQMGVDALDRLGITDGPFREWRARTLAAIDGPAHAQLRALVGRAFTPRQVERVRPVTRARAVELIDAGIERGELDVVADFARDIPLLAACRFLGIDDGSRDEIDSFLAGTEEGFVDPMTPERRARAEGSIVALYGVIAREIAARRSKPTDDLISAIVAAQDGSTVGDDDLHALLVNIVGGAVGSTRAALANSVLLLAEHVDQADAVRRDPDLVRPAVEECLRFHPPFRVGRRKAVADVDAFGLELPAGSTVFAARQAANRDPDRFARPDEFDISRSESRHLTFGYGAHFCLGQALARANLQEAIGALLERSTTIELVSRPERVPFVMDEQLVDLRVKVTPR